MTPTFSETEYRAAIQRIYVALDRALEAIDPDVIEGESSLGSYTLTFGDRSRCILSAQPSVRQLWLALAAKGIAHHFSWSAERAEWHDDKGQGIELKRYLSALLSEQAGQEIRIA